MKYLTNGQDKFKINVITIQNSTNINIDVTTGEDQYIQRKQIIVGIDRNFRSDYDNRFYISLPYKILSDVKLPENSELIFTMLEDLVLSKLVSGIEYYTIGAHHRDFPNFNEMKIEELKL